MRISPAHRQLRRLGLIVGVCTVAACAQDSGCQGCNAGTPIPGGFPQAHRFDNAGQIRLSQSGIAYLEQNFEKLLKSFLPGGMTFTIPPSGCPGSQDPKVCCKGGPCTAAIDISSVKLTPKAGGILNLAIQAKVTTNKLYFEKDVWFYWLKCHAQYDTTQASPSTAGLITDIDLVIDANNNNKLKIVRQSMTITNFDCDDVDIFDGADCAVASWLCPLFKNTLLSGVKAPMEQAIDGLLKTLPTGTEARYDLSALLATFSPASTGKLDYFVWGGGYAQSESGGVSVGALGGFHAPTHNPCVPDCEKPNATCTAPPKAAITRSSVFRGNTRPDGKSFHVGIGVHRQTLDQATYALYSSGALCLDVDSELSTQLNSGIFSLLVPSLNLLTGGQTVPIMLAVRPQKPPRITLGAGTWHKDKNGAVVIDDPLLKIAAKNFRADVYALIEERWIRLFTIQGDLNVPALISADAKGRLQPMIGDLSKALTGIQVSNSELLTEDPTKLAKLFPTLLNLAAGMFSTSFDPIALPDIAGIKLVLDSGSFLSVDNKNVLAIFARLALLSNTSAALSNASASGDTLAPSETSPGATRHARRRVDTEARVVRLDIPRTLAFAVTHADFDPAGSPAVILDLGAQQPAGVSASRGGVEWSLRIDGGFWRPFTNATRVVVHDPRFWLQGHHTLDVQARLIGHPETTDLTPAHLDITIDTVPPTIRLIRTARGVRAEVHDLVTPQDHLTVRWRVDGQTAESNLVEGNREIVAPANAQVGVDVRDQAGNTTSRQTLVADVPLPTDPASAQGGCHIDATGTQDGGTTLPSLLLLGLALGLTILRRRH